MRVVFLGHDGSRHEVEGQPGRSLMLAAVTNNVPGIIGECGGSCSCGTCHVYLDAGWLVRVDSASEQERSMLEMVIEPAANSRLACQIRLTEAMAGLTATMPRSQI